MPTKSLYDIYSLIYRNCSAIYILFRFIYKLYILYSSKDFGIDSYIFNYLGN